jgi:septal ring factor EnvC (AmiA/AmiB activator)
MAFAIASISKLLVKIAEVAHATHQSTDTIRQLVDSVRKPGAGTQKQLDDLKQAIELQDTVNKEMNEQLKLVRSVLENVEKSLKIWSVATVGIGVLALTALIIAIVK